MTGPLREALVFAFLFSVPADRGGADLHYITAPDYAACVAGAALAARRYALPVIWCDAHDANDMARFIAWAREPGS